MRAKMNRREIEIGKIGQKKGKILFKIIGIFWELLRSQIVNALHTNAINTYLQQIIAISMITQ